MKYFGLLMGLISCMVCQADEETMLQSMQRHLQAQTVSLPGAVMEVALAATLISFAAEADNAGEKGAFSMPLLLGGSWLLFDASGRAMITGYRFLAATFPPR